MERRAEEQRGQDRSGEEWRGWIGWRGGGELSEEDGRGEEWRREEGRTEERRGVERLGRMERKGGGEKLSGEAR